MMSADKQRTSWWI